MIINHGQVGFISGIQVLFNIHKLINVIHYSNKFKNKNHMITCLDTEKAFWQNSTFIYHKDSQQNGCRGNISEDNKGHLWQSYSEHYTQQWKSENIPSKIRNKTRMPTLNTFIQYSIGSPSHKNQTRKRNKRIQTGKEEIKLSMFPDNMIQYSS